MIVIEIEVHHTFSIAILLYLGCISLFDADPLVVRGQKVYVFKRCGGYLNYKFDVTDWQVDWVVMKTTFQIDSIFIFNLRTIRH